MSYRPLSPRSFQVLSGFSGVVGVMMLGISFAINQAPPFNATVAELIAYGTAKFANIM
jgi:hypothetical protein